MKFAGKSKDNIAASYRKLHFEWNIQFNLL